MSLDIGPAIREAFISDAFTTERLAQWKGEPAIFTRRPLPSDATFPCLAISPDISIADFDALNSERPIVVRDVIFYGIQPGDYRIIEELGYRARELCHRSKGVINPSGYQIIDVVARGPFPAPTDDEKKVARLVSLTFRLRRN